MARPAIGNSNGQGTQEPIIKIPNGEDIIIQSNGWDLVMNENCLKIINKKTGKIVFKIDNTEVIIGNSNGEHIRLKQ